jgi:hypothetical protein
MNDKEFSELELRATIVPQQARCPAPAYLHWHCSARILTLWPQSASHRSSSAEFGSQQAA